MKSERLDFKGVNIVVKKGGNQEMKKRGFVFAVFLIFSLVAATFTGAKALYESKPVPTEKRHSISEIIQPGSKWEKVATGHGFMEGINFDRNGEIWLVSPMTGEILGEPSRAGGNFSGSGSLSSLINCSNPAG